jgi:quinol monooxygenase YgiN
MITVLFSVTIKDGKEQDFHELALRLTKVSREDDGCLIYVFHRRSDNPREYVLYEQWRDRGAHKAHLAHLESLLGAPSPGGGLPDALLKLCEHAQSVFYDVVD